MNDQELERLLVEWGTLSKYTAEIDERGGSHDFHVLDRNRDFAPGTRARAAARIVGRDGFARRTLMARELAGCGVRIVGASFVDPVPCNPTRKRAPAASVAHSIPPHLKPVHEAARELRRFDTLAGACLRQEYCGYGPQVEKAERVGLAIGSRVGLRMYRESLALARGWMLAKLSA